MLSECQEEGEQGWSDRRVEEWRERGRRERLGGGGWGMQKRGAPAASQGLTLIRHDTHTHTPGKKSDKCN